MATVYKNLFKPCVLSNGVILKNRICSSNGQQSRVTGPEGAPNEALIDDIAAFARGGVSMQSFGHFGGMGGGAVPHFMPPVDKKAVRAAGGRVVVEDKLEPLGGSPHYNYEDPKVFNIIGQVAEAVHMFDGKVLVKLGGAFPPGITLNGVEEWEELLLFPVPKEDKRLSQSSHFAAPTPPGAPVPTLEELRSRCATKEQIVDCIEDIVDMCMRYKNAGFDGMSFRGDRWGLNACTNVRDDEYNGEIEARGRFQYELYAKVKEVCGPEFIVQVVMPGDSTHGHDGQLPHGYTEDEFIRFMKLVEDVIDVVEIREQTGMGYQCLSYNSELHTHQSYEIAKHLRAAGFKKTIAVNGGYNDPDEMEQIISEGVVDLIATARTYRAEPDFMKKLRSNGAEAPTPCLRCNKCHGSHDAIAVCSVNPRNALNHRLPLLEKPPERSKKVAIIGGGPIGMRTACFSAERGHQVTLFEKDSKLGGKPGYYAYLYPDKWNIKRYIDWLTGEVGRRGVDVRLNCAPDPDDLAAEGFDAVIACTGSHEKRPPIEGADAAGVYLNEDVYTGKVLPGQKVIIVGGGDVSTETAMYLASTGREVTVLTRRNQLMNQNQNYIHGPTMCNLIYLPELGYGGYAACYTKYDSITPVFRVTTTKVTPHSVIYVRDGKEVILEADTVIVSGGYQPNAAEALKFSECTPEFYMAGDNRVDNNCLMHGNRSAYGRAIML